MWLASMASARALVHVHMCLIHIYHFIFLHFGKNFMLFKHPPVYMYIFLHVPRY